MIRFAQRIRMQIPDIATTELARQFDFWRYSSFDTNYLCEIDEELGAAAWCSGGELHLEPLERYIREVNDEFQAQMNPKHFDLSMWWDFAERVLDLNEQERESISPEELRKMIIDYFTS